VKAAPWLLVAAGVISPGRRIELEPAEARHAIGSLRLRPGDLVVVTDGAGVTASATLVDVRRGRADVEIGSVDRVARPSPGLTIAVGVLAGSAMDFVVQKSVELGVERVVPVSCARSQLGLERAAARCEHWRRVGFQALKQCRRPWAMEVADPMSLPQVLHGVWSAGGVVADPDGATPKTISRDRCRCLLVGPEGGFDDDELAAIRDAGWPSVRLGPHVLRAETAAIAGAAVVGWRVADGVHSADD
jgi:16S rRNA (uracil1498-N3)-methyltransferase